MQKRTLPKDIPTQLWNGENTLLITELLVALELLPSKHLQEKGLKMEAAIESCQSNGLPVYNPHKRKSYYTSKQTKNDSVNSC